MKTTLELPEALVAQIRQRAVQQGREVNEVIADLLTAGVVPAKNDRDDDRLVAKTLPLIKVRHTQPPDRQLAAQEFCDWIKELDLQVDLERHEKAFGHQHVDRADG